MYGLPPEVLVEARDSVRIVTLNRPDRHNAVNDRMHTALAEVWGHLAADPDVAAVVVTGAGQAFSGGGDLTWFGDIATDDRLRERVLAEGRIIIDAMLDLKAPVVAAVNGAAVGLGCSIAVMADVVLMSETAFLADPHVAVGLAAGDGGVATWPLMTSMLRAKEYILLGDRVPAVEAERIGLANRVVAPDDLRREALKLSERFAALPRQAVRATKQAFNLHVKDSVNRVVDFAFQAEGESFQTDAHRTTVARLLDGGK